MALLREKDRKYQTPEDICEHLGDDYDDWQGAINPPIYQTTLFAFDEGQPREHTYTRMSNPTTEVAERKIAALEGADGALCFSSGMGAISSAIMHFIKKDCHVIMVKSTYGDTRAFLTEYLRKFGVTVTGVHGDDFEEIKNAVRDNTALIYLESPSSVVFKMQDLEKIARLARERGIGTVIDNTYATPLHQQPLKWGIDISVHTLSKYLCGHSNVVGGVVCAREEIILEMQNKERKFYGSLLGPMESYLLAMGMRTFPLRMRQHGENGKKVAAFLEGHPRVAKVYYPGSETYEQKELFEKYLTGTNGLLSFVLKGTAEDAEKFISSLKHFIRGVSWGGFESLVFPQSVGLTEEEAAGKDTLPNTIRLHIGLENVNTLIADLEEALNAIG